MSFSTPPASEDQQPVDFSFTAKNLAKAQEIIDVYPPGKQASAVMPLLDLAQRQEGWVSRVAMDVIADMLEMPRIRVYEVASFYSMYRRAPVGKYVVGVCTTTPCWLCGSDEILKAFEKRLGIKPGETSADGKITLQEVECLGACVNGPMLQVNDDYYEDLNGSRTEILIDALMSDNPPKPGPTIRRQTSCPASGPTTLKDDA